MQKTRLILSSLLSMMTMSCLFADEETSLFIEENSALSKDEETSLFAEENSVLSKEENSALFADKNSVLSKDEETFLLYLADENIALKTNPNAVLLEFRPSYFIPISKRMREVFGNGGINYQITGTFPVYSGNKAWMQGINIWAAVDYFHWEGRTTRLDYKTKLRIVPLTLGLKFFFPDLGHIAPINFYVGSSIKYFFVYNYTNSNYLKRSIDTSGVGGVVETGFTITVMKHLVFDIFASYSFRTFGAPPVSHYPASEPTAMNISGVNVGGGLGYKF